MGMQEAHCLQQRQGPPQTPKEPPAEKSAQPIREKNDDEPDGEAAKKEEPPTDEAGGQSESGEQASSDEPAAADGGNGKASKDKKVTIPPNFKGFGRSRKDSD